MYTSKDGDCHLIIMNYLLDGLPRIVSRHVAPSKVAEFRFSAEYRSLLAVAAGVPADSVAAAAGVGGYIFVGSK